MRKSNNTIAKYIVIISVVLTIILIVSTSLAELKTENTKDELYRYHVDDFDYSNIDERVYKGSYTITKDNIKTTNEISVWLSSDKSCFINWIAKNESGTYTTSGYDCNYIVNDKQVTIDVDLNTVYSPSQEYRNMGYEAYNESAPDLSKALRTAEYNDNKGYLTFDNILEEKITFSLEEYSYLFFEEINYIYFNKENNEIYLYNGTPLYNNVYDVSPCTENQDPGYINCSTRQNINRDDYNIIE